MGNENRHVRWHSFLPVCFANIYYAEWVSEMMVFSSRQISQGKVFSGHRPLTPSSVPLQPDFFLLLCSSCFHLSETFLLYFIPVFPCRLPILNGLSSQCLPLFDPTFSPACSRPLVLTVFQLPLLCCLLFLVSLLSQPSNTWPTAPRPSFKPHEFLNGFLLQSSTSFCSVA